MLGFAKTVKSMFVSLHLGPLIVSYGCFLYYIYTYHIFFLNAIKPWKSMQPPPQNDHIGA